MPKKRLPLTLLTLSSIALAAWFFAEATFWLLREPSAGTPYNASAPAGRADAETRPLASSEGINARNLFGAAVFPPGSRHARGTKAEGADEEAIEAGEADALPISKKNWKLFGTIVNSGAHRESRAVIQIDGKEQAYREGDSIQGWKIALVQRRSLVLSKGGTRERLIMGDAAAPARAESKADEQKAVSRSRLREEIADLGALMRNVSVSPQAVGGYRGLRIVALQSGSYLEELGLQKDDLLLGANEKPLTGFGDLASLGDLADKDAITLEILRNGKKTIIRYDVQS